MTQITRVTLPTMLDSVVAKAMNVTTGVVDPTRDPRVVAKAKRASDADRVYTIPRQVVASN